nr:DUF5712 family protein [Chryseobacterium sp. JUb7]
MGNTDRAKLIKLNNSLHLDRVTQQIVKEGMKKGGDQYHVHIVVSRYDNTPDKRHKMSLSPLSNKKQGNQADNLRKEGFDRDNFFSKLENRFDEKYNFERENYRSYDHFKSKIV